MGLPSSITGGRCLKRSLHFALGLIIDAMDPLELELWEMPSREGEGMEDRRRIGVRGVRGVVGVVGVVGGVLAARLLSEKSKPLLSKVAEDEKVSGVAWPWRLVLRYWVAKLLAVAWSNMSPGSISM